MNPIFFFFQAEDGIRYHCVTGVQTCALPIWSELQDLRPLISEGASDSAALDGALELLIQSGRSPLHALMMVMPEAYKDAPDVDEDLRGFYDYHKIGRASCRERV